MLIRTFIKILFLSALLSSCATQNPQVRIVTNQGDIELELDRVKAPKSVDNFLQYSKDGYYNNTIFHRVIKGFMIQGGGFDEDLNKKNTRQPIENEANNGLKNDLGTIAMARTNMPHSASAQFFINTAQNDFLNHTAKTPRGWGYAVFGKVTKGIEVVKAIENTATGPKGIFPSDVPVETIKIERVEIIKD